jgi:hypothetical protein
MAPSFDTFWLKSPITIPDNADTEVHMSGREKSLATGELG